MKISLLLIVALFALAISLPSVLADESSIYNQILPARGNHVHTNDKCGFSSKFSALHNSSYLLEWGQRYANGGTFTLLNVSSGAGMLTINATTGALSGAGEGVVASLVNFTAPGNTFSTDNGGNIGRFVIRLSNLGTVTYQLICNGDGPNWAETNPGAGLAEWNPSIPSACSSLNQCASLITLDGQTNATLRVGVLFYDSVTPDTPTLSLAMAARAINLTWTPSANSTVYNVWRDTRTHDITCAVMGSCTMNGTGFNYYGNTTNTWWDTTGDSAINNNSAYFYVVNAANSGGESAPSNIANWTYNVPNATIGTLGAGSVPLSWNAVNGADHYNIYQALSASADFTPMNATAYTYVATVNSSPYTVTGLTGGTTYHFRVQALNTSSAEGWASPDVNATPPTGTLPSAPTLSSMIQDGQHALLTWTTPATVGDGLLGYNITRTGDCGTILHLPVTNSQLIGLCTQNATFTVHAWNDAGDGPESNTIMLRQGPQTFGGETSSFFNGNLTTYAAQIGTTPSAVELAYAFLITLLAAGAIGIAWTMLGGQFTQGAPYGAVAGYAISLALGFIPLWVTLLLLAAGALAIIVKIRSSRNGGA